MAVELFVHVNLFAVVVVLVLVRILTLFNQVVLHLLNFNHLLTLPACCQHGTLLPVVDVNWLRVEVWVITVAEIAHVLVLMQRAACVFLPVIKRSCGCWRLFPSTLNFRLVVITLVFLLTSLGSLGIDVCGYADLGMVSLVTSRSDFCNCCIDLFKLSRA